MISVYLLLDSLIFSPFRLFLYCCLRRGKTCDGHTEG